MSLAEAIAGLARVRGMKPAEVADSLAGLRNRATLYRVLNGTTTDPRTSTLLEMCRTLHTSPGELLQLAGLHTPPDGGASLLDTSLRQAFGELHDLSEDDRWVLLGVLRSIIKERGPRRRARPLGRARGKRAADERRDGSADR
jgi:DNA-binding Xre family transcriptional regulator